ncbi:DNA repair protein RecN [Falsiporphyromonas endometrii]|uniref:DNA repair protein RecN n=1 Tax=Falsiporphyromonas endometrii TaxID=1387297 RepID=A0ABV9K537_9PORP|nr:DNA repair protein RecN [Porphyromonadaceae bacterium]
MLSSLHISQYVLIDNLEINFSDGFTVISGETGAGKSILLGALSLVLGKRADTSEIAIGKDKCVVEATFSNLDSVLEAMFEEEDLDFSRDECILRREISAKGKSRAFVNDTPVSLTVLKKIGEKLVDIHSQHKNLLLGDAHFQLSTLDILSANTSLLKEYQERYLQYRKALEAYEKALKVAQEGEQEADYLQFQYDELEQAEIKEGEEVDLESELKMLSHAVEIAQGLSESNDLLLQNDENIVTSLVHTIDVLRRLEPFMEDLKPYCERLESAQIEIKDVAESISSLSEQLEVDPERLLYVEERLNTINKLLMKHKVTTTSELFEIKEQLGQRLDAINNKDQHIAKLKSIVEDKLFETNAYAKKLTAQRQKAGALLSKTLESELPLLGIPKVVFKVAISDVEPNMYGRDKVTFLFSANMQQPPEAVADIASGGEIARLMLCIKSLVADKKNLPTIIFDEIDTGISGDIAGRMAKMLQRMARTMQVVAITHLPQIAAAGKDQLFVYKLLGEDKTRTTMKKLSQKERIEEIARMQSGSELTDISLAAAEELLKNSVEL